jgi:hypothetical protein
MISNRWRMGHGILVVRPEHVPRSVRAWREHSRGLDSRSRILSGQEDLIRGIVNTNEHALLDAMFSHLLVTEKLIQDHLELCSSSGRAIAASEWSKSCLKVLAMARIRKVLNPNFPA